MWVRLAMKDSVLSVSSLSILVNSLVIESKAMCCTHCKKPKKAVISLRIEGDFFAQAFGDDIGDTLDYGQLAHMIESVSDTLLCHYKSLEEKIGHIMHENFPNFSIIKVNLRFFCCRTLEKPHCFFLTNSLKKFL